MSSLQKTPSPAGWFVWGIMRVYSKPKALFVLLNVSFLPPSPSTSSLIKEPALNGCSRRTPADDDKQQGGSFCGALVPFPILLSSPQDPGHLDDANLTAIDVYRCVFINIRVRRSLVAR